MKRMKGGTSNDQRPTPNGERRGGKVGRASSLSAKSERLLKTEGRWDNHGIPEHSGPSGQAGSLTYSFSA
jgi:hypothetical protein